MPESRATSISIHAPRTGSDVSRCPKTQHPAHFNPRSPHGERRTRRNDARKRMEISIHAPRTGSDNKSPRQKEVMIIFQSTLPARGATSRLSRTPQSQRISIHAPRTGSDLMAADGGSKWRRYFNPRSPHGERPVVENAPHCQRNDFNPRSPHGERPVNLFQHQCNLVISIHAPRTGSDSAK